jgi:polar amino acid transport system substrate-binding protein
MAGMIDIQNNHSGRLIYICQLLFVLFSVSQAGNAWSAAPVLVLNNVTNAPYTTEQHDGFLDVITTLAFHRAGLNLKLIKQPAERGLQNANTGKIDGDLTRIKNIQDIYPNLVRIPEKLMDWEFAAFSNNRHILTDWQTITSHSVGFIKGWKIYEHKTRGVHAITVANTPLQLFRLLHLGRVNSVLYEKWQGLEKSRAFSSLNNDIHVKTLEKRPMYIYLNKRHKKYIEKINSSLKALKQDGVYTAEYNKRVLPYLKEAMK